MRIVAIEEHYATPGLLKRTGLDLSWFPGDMAAKLNDTGDGRLDVMDAAGIDLQVLSAVAPATQEMPPGLAVHYATCLNTDLHKSVIQAHPDRFAGFATLPTNRPSAAADELHRCVTELGFVGALINGTTRGRFLDHPRFEPILKAAEDLDVPIYLHPSVPPKPVLDTYYNGLATPVDRMLAMSAYGWHFETALHALRLIVHGVLDRFPRLQIILGHMAEGLPFHIERVDDMMAGVAGLEKPVSQYLRDNFWATTAGYPYDGPLRLTRELFGDDRVLFSVDYPFADSVRSAQWLHDLDITPDLRERLAHRNADRLLGLGDPSGPCESA